MAADFLSLLSSIPSIMSAFSGGTSAPYLKQQQQLAGQQANISQALTNTNNPLYQQLYGQYKQQNQANLADTISQAQGQNRMNAAMGRVPLFNQERGSENIFRNLVQQQQQSGVQADQQTRQALMGGMVGTNAAATDYNNLSKFGQAANSAQLGGYNQIYNLLKGYGVGQENSQLSGAGGSGTPVNPNYQQPNYFGGATSYGMPKINSYQ